ncbi:MAG: iron-containing alcohol dehydrogenase [Fuerstiella sp.]|nr:iron-containing alcohol dehydrogenase [Fuerstiella sp.]MCP4857863.1 iron-containing alcohol dehydrogenase [Fuerstiella sp.]
MSDVWTFHSAGQLVFGSHAAAQLGQIAAKLGLKRVFTRCKQQSVA